MIARSVTTPVLLATGAVLGVALLVVGARLATDPLVRALPDELLPTLVAALLAPLVAAALPLALFAGLVTGLARIDGDGGIDAARALGASPWQLAAPTLLLATAVGGLTYVAGAWGEPWGRLRARQALEEVRGPDLRGGDGPLVIEVDGSVLGASSLDGAGVLRDVLLYRMDGDEVVLAPAGQVSLGDGTVEATLRDGEIHRRLPGGGYARLRFDRYHASLPLPLVRRPGREPFELAPGPLLRAIDRRRAAGHEIRFHLLALHRRISGALAVPLLAVLAWGLSGGRRGRGAARGLVLALALALGYYLLLRLGDHGLRRLHWPPLVAAYLATAALAAVSAAAWRARWSP